MFVLTLFTQGYIWASAGICLLLEIFALGALGSGNALGIQPRVSSLSTNKVGYCSDLIVRSQGPVTSKYVAKLGLSSYDLSLTPCSTHTVNEKSLINDIVRIQLGHKCLVCM